jgi:cytochrome b subunit of formate dehydrogenase
MSIHDYLHEKAAESRHNEIIAYIMFLTGSVFCVGGILSSLVMSQEPSWFLFIPYIADFTEAMFLELGLLIVGLFLIVASIGSGVHYYRARSWYLKELAKAKDGANNMKPQRMQFGKLNYSPEVENIQQRTKTN